MGFWVSKPKVQTQPGRGKVVCVGSLQTAAGSRLAPAACPFNFKVWGNLIERGKTGHAMSFGSGVHTTNGDHMTRCAWCVVGKHHPVSLSPLGSCQPA